MEEMRNFRKGYHEATLDCDLKLIGNKRARGFLPKLLHAGSPNDR